MLNGGFSRGCKFLLLCYGAVLQCLGRIKLNTVYLSITALLYNNLIIHLKELLLVSECYGHFTLQHVFLERIPVVGPPYTESTHNGDTQTAHVASAKLIAIYYRPINRLNRQ